MAILDLMQPLGDRLRGVVRTPYGTLRLAKDGKRVQKATIDLNLATDALTRRDIADWRMAWQRAINVERPDRKTLYDIYRDVEVDAHLSGCVGQRTGFVLARSFKLTDARGNQDEEALHYLDQGWFKRFCLLALESVYWGHSLIELGDVITDGDGCKCLDGVTLIPRKHVIPEYGRVVVNAWDDWHNGIDYRTPPFSDFLVEAGSPSDLGLYLKAAIHTIPKKNMLAFWAAFGETFGMPMRLVKTSSRDPNVLDKILSMMARAAGKQAVVVDSETDVQFVESTRGDAYNVYDRRVDRANSELSKLVIGQTMTIEDGSSLSQSQTHLEVFKNLVEADSDMLRDVINNQLLPRLVRLGFPLDGLRFDWDYSVDYTPEQQIQYETMIADRYEVDPQYFAEKYSMPVGERLSMPMTPGTEPDTPPSGNGKEDSSGKGKEEGNGKQQNAHPFFD